MGLEKNKLISICPKCNSNNFHQEFIKNLEPKEHFPKGATYKMESWKGKCTTCGFKDGGTY